MPPQQRIPPRRCRRLPEAARTGDRVGADRRRGRVLAETLGDFSYACLVTVGDDYRSHAVAVDPVLTDGSGHIASVGNGVRVRPGGAVLHTL